MGEALQQKLLVDADIEDYLRAVPLPPAVPTNWKPGLFSSDRPWGSLEEAVALLASGKVAEGRELLRRLAKHTADPAVKAVFARELFRPPEDGKLSWTYLTQLLLESSEFNAIRARRALSGGDYDLGSEFFLKANGVRPASVYGCVLLSEAWLYSSDLYFQTRLLLPRKRKMESVIVTSALKGAAQLSLRRHEEAWNTFKLGWVQADEKAKAYGERLEVEMTADERRLIVETMSLMGATGMGLVLFDLGLRRAAAEIFAALVAALQDSLQYAAQVLSRA